MKIRTLPANKYYKPGTEIDAEEGYANRMITKGFAESAEEASGNEDKKSEKPNEKELAAIANAKTIKALNKLLPSADAHEDVKTAYLMQLEFIKSNTKNS